MDGTILVYAFAGTEARPAVIAKRAALTSAAREAEVLACLGQPARQAGVRVPEARAVSQNGSSTWLLQTALAGQRATTRLRARPRQLDMVAGALVDWLERWHRTTRTEARLGQAELRQAVVRPAEILAPLMEAEAYLRWLTAGCAAQQDTHLPLVAAHNDLTMENVLVDERRGLGIVDWEKGTAQGWPLTDFFYALSDAVACAWNLKDRLAAVQACFAAGGHWAAKVAGWQARLRDAVGLTTKQSELCFHACWLQHALNEQHDPPPNGDRPFLAVVQWLARRPVLFTAAGG
jgi:aminoglycoside phosphotransferase